LVVLFTICGSFHRIFAQEEVDYSSPDYAAADPIDLGESETDTEQYEEAGNCKK